MITLAVATGISAEQWGREGAQAIATGLEVLAERYGRTADEPDMAELSEEDDRPQYSG